MMNTHFGLLLLLVGLAWLLSGASSAFASTKEGAGGPVNIAPSAYKYRADRKPEANDPESWFAVMRYAGLPLNQKVDLKSPAVQRALCGLLWEEIRPVDRLVLSWPRHAKRRPAPEDLEVATLDHQGSASSWWNNLASVPWSAQPSVSDDGLTYTYDLRKATCGIVVGVRAPHLAADVDVPTVSVSVADRWKAMSVEVEWGFEAARAGKDYGGRVEAYDGRFGRIEPLDGDATTKASGPARWSSAGKSQGRRGVKFDLLYMGQSKWRKTQPYTSKRDDVARTIVTLWTKSGNCSFLASDLERGPIYVPEHGFFVRGIPAGPAPDAVVSSRRESQDLLGDKMDSIAGSSLLKGWGSDATPWFGGNGTDSPVSVQGIDLPAQRLAMHPGPDRNVGVGRRLSIAGTVAVEASLAHAQQGSDGIEWWIVVDSKAGRTVANHGVTDGKEPQRAAASGIKVEPGDTISLVVGPRGTHYSDTTAIEFTVRERGGKTWDLTEDVVGSIHAGNPRDDGWSFFTEDRDALDDTGADAPPISLASNAKDAKTFLKELASRRLSTIRERVREHEEQSWEGAVAAFHSGELPAHPAPPAGMETPMRVEVPSERLTAQWNLAKWHMVRHCATHPTNGKLWFNDFPYGILAAETYMVLRTLDLIGAHHEAEDGFDQWVSLPMDTDSAGHNEGALRDRPNGLFTDGHGCLTAAVGPDGWGGQMDGVHAFGPGAIGWALMEHYRMSGDLTWLKASAGRIRANAEWMLRQRRVLAESVPGGERLWCKGLQPPLQVTPDSGGEWMQFYEAEAYYWASISHLAADLAAVDPAAAKKLAGQAEAYRKDLRAAVDRSIALSPVVPVRDGTHRSVIPFGCYVRGLGTGAWGWNRDNSGSHVGPLYWETVQSAAPLVTPAGLLSPTDGRVQGYLDVLEDRLLFENPRAERVDWFSRSFQYQMGLERTANMHLAADDVPNFLRTWLNGYGVDVLPNDGWVFAEHVYRGPADKIYEEAAFLERFRDMLIAEDGGRLWLAKATPRAWLAQGERISVKDAPTHFGTVDFEIVSDVDRGAISAAVKMPARGKADVWLRLRHPGGDPIQSVTVNGKPWKAFDAKLEVVKLSGLKGTVKVEARYGRESVSK